MNSPPDRWTRRKFVHCSLAGGVAGTLAASGPVAGAAEAPAQSDAQNDEQSDENKGAGNGIAELRLQTTRMDAIETFYRDDLGLPAVRNGDVLTIEAGTTRIIFSTVEQGEPFYHFAFNIPENKLELARRWQKKRTELVRKGNSEVVHFAKWNADSVFFRDPAGNLLEYIARHDLPNGSKGEFSTADILYASEIGLVVDDVARTVAAAKSDLNLGIYRDNSSSFASIGDEHALLVVVKRNRKWFPARKRAAKVFPLRATIRRPTVASLVMNKYGYHVSTK